MNVIQAFASGSDVNYEDFLKAVKNAGAVYQDDASPHIINAMREQVHQRINSMSAHERTTVDKLRRIAQNSSVSDIQGIFAKFA